MSRRGPARYAKLAALISIPAVLISSRCAIATAQSPTPEATGAAATGQTTTAAPVGPTATPDLSIRTVVRIEVDPQPQPLKAGTEFEARIIVDNVDHLAGFEFSIGYDPKRVEPVKSSSSSTTPAVTPVLSSAGEPVQGRSVGEFLASSPRAEGMFCSSPAVQDNTVMATCVTGGAPLCQGGLVGASGSGLLEAVTFKAKGGGPTTLTLTKSVLLSDDVQPPCDPNDPTDFQSISIPSRQQNADLNLARAGSASNSKAILFVALGVVAVVVVVAGGVGGYFLLRGR